MNFGKKRTPSSGQWIRQMNAERVVQIHKGYTDEHDLDYGILHLIDVAVDYARQGRNLESATVTRQIGNLLPRFFPEPPIPNDEKISGDTFPGETAYTSRWTPNQLFATADEMLEARDKALHPNDTEEHVNKRAEVLRHAEDLINGDRAQTYGPPETSFGRHADIWNAMGYRRHVQVEDAELGITQAEELDAVDAALILMGLKLSRAANNHGTNADDWVDMAGYAGLGAELADTGDISDEPEATSNEHLLTFTYDPYYGSESVRCSECSGVMKEMHASTHTMAQHPEYNGYRTEKQYPKLGHYRDPDMEAAFIRANIKAYEEFAKPSSQ